MSGDDLTTRLERFLARQIPDAREIVVKDCQPLSGGYSRVMTQFTAIVDGEPRRYVCRSDPPPGLATIETDRDQEWAVARALSEAGAPVPRADFYDAEGSIMGTKTMILEFVNGPSLLAQMRQHTDDAAQRRQAEQLCDLAVACHAVDLAALPAAMPRPATWDDYFASCIAEWRRVEAEHCESLPLFRHLAAWFERNRPPAAPLTLVHGEYQPTNIVMGDEKHKPVVVDWEFAHIGDPREDLGWAKYMGATVQPPDLIGRDEEAFCHRYRSLTGLDEDVINPWTLAYFMLLPAGRSMGLLLRSVSAFTTGATNSLIAPYMGLGYLGATQTFWMQTARALDRLRRPTRR